MKIPRIIVRGLASGALRMGPGVMLMIKKLSGYANAGAAPAQPQEQSRQPRCQRRPVVGVSAPARGVRRSCVLLVFAALSFVQLATALEYQSAFDAANQAFANGKPVEAAHALEGIIGKQGYSAPVLFNLANAQLRAANTGQAVLNYERARWLSPADPDIAANLRLARERTQSVSAAASPLRFANWTTVNAWAGIGAGSLLLVAATLPLALLVPRQRRVLWMARIQAVVVLLSSLVAIGARWGELSRAVVTAKAADARISPVTVGAPTFTLPEGTVVSIVKSHGPFTLVNARGGQRGWVSSDTIEPVIKPAS